MFQKNLSHSNDRFAVPDILGKTFSFSPKKYPFDVLFLEIVNRLLRERGENSLCDLSRLHETSLSNELLYEELYRFEETAEFKSLYRHFFQSEITPHFPYPVRFQRKPGIRIHRPQGITVQFHTDEWYGHGPDVFNIWLPITDARATNSMWVASLGDSLAETMLINRERLPLSEINQRLIPLCHPVESKFGSYYVFNSRSVHGSKRNETGETRVSIDFRIIAEEGNAGTKAIASYFQGLEPIKRSNLKSASLPVPATAYMDMRHGFCPRIKSDHQRTIIHEFARTRNVTFVAEEMEIQTMIHHPMLLHLASGKEASKVIVLFSIWSMPSEKIDRDAIYEASETSGVELWFANEGLLFPSEASRLDIERCRE